MADLYQKEATPFFRGLGFHTHKIVDLHFETRKGFVTRNASERRVMPAEAGHFDMIFLCGLMGGVCEVKTGEATRFPFDAVRQEQIDWYWRVAVPKRLSAWLYFVVGERAREDDATWQEIVEERRSRKAKTKRQIPRVTILMPFGRYLERTEQVDRRSFSYEYIMTELAGYRLRWRNGGWQLPVHHPFQGVFYAIQGTRTGDGRGGAQQGIHLPAPLAYLPGGDAGRSERDGLCPGGAAGGGLVENYHARITLSAGGDRGWEAVPADGKPPRGPA